MVTGKCCFVAVLFSDINLPIAGQGVKCGEDTRVPQAVYALVHP